MPRHSPSKGGKDNCATDRRTIKASASNTCRLTDTENMELTLNQYNSPSLRHVSALFHPWHEDTRRDSEHNSTLRHMFIHFSCHINKKPCFCQTYFTALLHNSDCHFWHRRRLNFSFTPCAQTRLLPSVQQLQTFHALWLALCPCLASAGETKDDSSTLQAGLMVREYVSINIMVGIPRSKVIYYHRYRLQHPVAQKRLLPWVKQPQTFYATLRPPQLFTSDTRHGRLSSDPFGSICSTETLTSLLCLAPAPISNLELQRLLDNIPPCTSADYLLLPFNHQKIQLL